MKKLIRGERGYVLIAALVVLLVLGLISGPLLSYMVSGLRAGHVFETGAGELYAADAGVQDAVLRIPTLGLGMAESCRTRNFTISDVNGKTVYVTVTMTNNVTGTLTYKITSIAVTEGGSNTAGLDSQTTVESYLVFTPGDELDIFSGALASQTSLDLAKDTIVNGDIYYCDGDLDDSDIVSGDWSDEGCAPFPSLAQNEAFAQVFEDEALDGITWEGDMDVSSSMILGSPGHVSYITGDLTVSKDLTITLDGIVYVKGSITCEKTLTITGSGSLIAEGSIDFRKLADYAVAGDSIIMSLYGDITIKKASPDDTLSINALIYAPYGQISLDKDMTVIGGVVGESIVVDMDGSFTFVPKTSWDFPGGLPGAYTLETYDVSRSD
jgi:hypothetical protein